MLEVALVKPRIGRMGMKRYVDAGRMEPLQMGILAALLAGQAEVTFWDDRVDDIEYNRYFDAVFITVETFTATRAYEIAGEFRRRGVSVILGGMHPTLAPEEAGEHADSVFTGDAENGFRELVGDLARGRLKPRYDGEPGAVQPGIRPDRSIFRGKGYLPVSLVQLGRGCPHACVFCATSQYFGGRFHYRPQDEVLDEIQKDCSRLLFFVDDNFCADADYAKSFMQKLIPLKRLWVTQVTVNVGCDPELLDLMERSGCLGFVVGFESTQRESLAWMAKPHALGSGRPYEREIESFREHGLSLWAAFTIGHDDDTPKSLWETYEFARRCAFPFAAFNTLTPYPGTKLYRQLEAEGRLLFGGRWWTHPSYRFNDAVFTPRHMSPEELTRIGWELRRKYNSSVNMGRRLLRYLGDGGRLVMLGAYISYLRIFRQEIYSKQHLHLGVGAGGA
ncbi:MAG: radical SAM protein [Spirochaetia bacterium]|jgi:radical SAM superfamily enzyme YgiQ (UPF0313 family)